MLIVIEIFWVISVGLYCTMPKDVTYRKWELEGVKRAKAAFWNGDIGLAQLLVNNFPRVALKGHVSEKDNFSVSEHPGGC
jgi:hypothetical protein